jgi:hypothetical protein
VTEPACASCGRQVRLRGTSPQGRICSGCMARRHRGLCASCGREDTLVGRNPDGEPWCQRCYRTLGPGRESALLEALAGRQVVLDAVRTINTELPEDTVTAILHTAIGVQSLGKLARHLQAYPDVLRTGPTSTPPALDRFVSALITAGAQQIRVIHPRCLDCGRDRPAHLRLDDGVICVACHARRRGKPACASCGKQRRQASRDEAGKPLCRSCSRTGTVVAERTTLLGELSAVLAPQAHLDSDVLATVLTATRPTIPKLRMLSGLLATHQLTDPELPFALARLVIALRAVGAQLPAPRCVSCRQATGTHVSLRGQLLRCRDCGWRCPSCSKPRNSDDQRPCNACRLDPYRRRGQCAGCQRVDMLLDDDRALCFVCRRHALRSCMDCRRNRALASIAGDKICQPCALRRTVDELLPEQPAGQLHRLRPAILAAEAMTTRRWMRRPAITELLTALDTGRLPMTHASLDAQPRSRGVEHLRDLLQAAGALRDDPERLLQHFQDDTERLLQSLDVIDARILRHWLRWNVLPKLRRNLTGTNEMRTAIAAAKSRLAPALSFVTGLEAAHRTLPACQQADLDGWFSREYPTRFFARPFLAWAQRGRHLPRGLTLPPAYRSRRGTILDSEQRWTIARRLVHDDTLDPVDRVAGAMLVLYAQSLVKICALTVDDVRRDGTTISVRLGDDRLELQEPFASLIQTLPMRRREGIAEQLPTTWLFPGARAGRHLTATILGSRLRAIGIDPGRMRITALDQLSKEIPPAMLTSILGLKASHTVRSTSEAGGDWAQYAASRST